MHNLRIYGDKPYSIAVIHGGPGAPGEMEPVARELSSIEGVLEPLQTAATIEGQVLELKAVLDENAAIPVVLVGFSWGAMLSFIFTARYPSSVKKLILVSSGPYEDKYAAGIMGTRLTRLNIEERKRVISLADELDNPMAKDKNRLMAMLGKLISKADLYKPLPYDDEILECQYDIYKQVWKEASELRITGKLPELGKEIQCPVVAMHGDYDAHPAEGVKEPLSKVVKDFRFILIEKCGHYPWREQDAWESFYSILKNEI